MTLTFRPQTFSHVTDQLSMISYQMKCQLLVSAFLRSFMESRYLHGILTSGRLHEPRAVLKTVSIDLLACCFKTCEAEVPLNNI
jgi:hypothetical protein